MPSIIGRIMRWEEYALSVILHDMLKAFSIATTTEMYEHACESGMWIIVTFEYKGRKYSVDGSRLDIVRKRLLKWIDENHIRDEFLSEKI